MNRWEHCVKTLEDWTPKVRQARGASMVSGIGTSVGNALSTALNVFSQPGRSLGAASMDALLSAPAGVKAAIKGGSLAAGAKAFSASRTRYFSEIPYEMYGMMKSMPSALKAAAMAMVSSGDSFLVPGTDTKPPATRIIGAEPAFRCRSAAPFSTAVVGRSLMCMG